MKQCYSILYSNSSIKRNFLSIINLHPFPVSEQLLFLNIYFYFYFSRFRLTYRLILREKELHFNLAVSNPCHETGFPFYLLLHTYFKVPDVRKVQISGLQGCAYIDKVSLNGYPLRSISEPSRHTRLRLYVVRFFTIFATINTSSSPLLYAGSSECGASTSHLADSTFII